MWSPSRPWHLLTEVLVKDGIRQGCGHQLDEKPPKQKNLLLSNHDMT